MGDRQWKTTRLKKLNLGQFVGVDLQRCDEPIVKNCRPYEEVNQIQKRSWLDEIWVQVIHSFSWLRVYYRDVSRRRMRPCEKCHISSPDF